MSEITFYYHDDSLAEQILAECDAELNRIHTLCNRFSDSSLISKLNRTNRVAAPSDIIHLFHLSDSISRLTGGLFDISVAPLMELWGFYEHAYKDPDTLQIIAYKELVDYTKIIVTHDSIFILPGMKIDVGGIAQGYAADRIARVLRKHNISCAIINIGGEIVAIGRSPEKRSWRIGIKHPRAQDLIETVEIEEMALSTSGDYEKFFMIHGKRYPHIIDPTTGFPARNFTSVTILAQSASMADAIATAVAIMGPEKGMIFLDSVGIRGIMYYESDGQLYRVENP